MKKIYSILIFFIIVFMFSIEIHAENVSVYVMGNYVGNYEGGEETTYWLAKYGELVADGANEDNYNVKYNKSEGKLTLNNAYIYGRYGCGIKANGDLILELIGDNEILCYQPNGIHVKNIGIDANKVYIVSEEGTLNLVVDDSDGSSIGIKSSVIVEGGNVNVNGYDYGISGSICSKGGTFFAEGLRAGITGSVKVEGGTLHIKGSGSGVSSAKGYGILCGEGDSVEIIYGKITIVGKGERAIEMKDKSAFIFPKASNIVAMTEAQSGVEDFNKERLDNYNYLSIEAKGLKKVSMLSLPNKLEYIFKEESFSAEGGMLLLEYYDGETKIVDLKEAEIVGFDNSILGEQIIIAKYDSFEFNIRIFIKPSLYGDVNKDGVVDIKDIYLLRLKSAKLIGFNRDQLIIGDIDLDGRITAIDTSLVRKYVLKIINVLV